MQKSSRKVQAREKRREVIRAAARRRAAKAARPSAPASPPVGKGGRGGTVARKEVRIARDLYNTPVDTALAACRRLDSLGIHPQRIVEPSAGIGNFVAAAKVVWPGAKIMAIDISDEHIVECYRKGAASCIVGRWQDQDVTGFAPDLILGNPPNSEAEEHILHCLAQLAPGAHLAFLQPVALITTQGRATRLWSSPPPFGHLLYLAPFAERPSFSGDGATDQCEYGFYVWQKGFALMPQIHPHIWKRESLLPEVPALAEPPPPEAA